MNELTIIMPKIEEKYEATDAAISPFFAKSTTLSGGFLSPRTTQDRYRAPRE
jgi:hypothetical protein